MYTVYTSCFSSTISVPNLSMLYQHQVFISSINDPIISVVGLKQFYFSITPELKYNSMFVKGMITLLYAVHAWEHLYTVIFIQI